MRILIIVTLLLSVIACNKPSSNDLIVGAIAGPETDLLKTAAEVANKRYGLNLKIVEFNDYNLPNAALQDRSIDANVFQHNPYLQAAMAMNDYNFEAIGKTFVFPIGLYSKKIQSLAELSIGAQIAVPNDPSNEVRALLLLQKAGLIRLKKTDAGLAAQIANNPLNDIISNSKSIKIKEIDAAQLPRVLDDVDAAIINSNFAKLAGLSLKHNAIYVEEKDSPYAEMVVIRRDSLKKRQLGLFVKALHSNKVLKKAEALFDKEAIPAW